MHLLIQRMFADNGFSSNSDGLILGLFGGFWLLIGLIALVSLILWIWALIDCLQREFPGSEKTTWILVLILGFFLGFGWLSAIIYLLAGRSHGKKVAAASSESESKKVDAEDKK